MRLKTAKKLQPGDTVSFKEGWMGPDTTVKSLKPDDDKRVVLLIVVEDGTEYNYRHFKEPTNGS